MPLRQGIKDGQLNWNDNRYLRLSATDQTVQGIVRFETVYADSMSITGVTVVSLTATDITTASLTVSDLTATYIPVAGVAGLLANSILTQTSTNTINAITTASATAYTVTLDNTTALSQGSTINFLHNTTSRGVIGCRARIESQAAYAGLGIQSADNLYLYSAGATTPQVMLNGTGLVIGSAGVTGNSLLDIYSASANPVLTISGVHATDYDPQIQFRTDASPTVKWSMGVDSLSGAVNDVFRIYAGSGVGTAGAINILTTNEIGINTTAVVGYGINMSTVSASNSLDCIGIRSFTIWTPTVNNIKVMRAAEFTARLDGTADVGEVSGALFFAYLNQGSGAVTNMHGAYFNFQVDTACTRVVTNFYGIRFNSTKTGAGAIPTANSASQLYLDDYTTEINATNKWGVLQYGTALINYFQNKITIGRGGPVTFSATALDIYDPASTAGKVDAVYITAGTYAVGSGPSIVFNSDLTYSGYLHGAIHGNIHSVVTWAAGLDFYINTGALRTTQTKAWVMHGTGGHLISQLDNQYIKFGAGVDAGIMYDGTNFQFYSQLVGTGHFIFNGGSLGIGTTPSAKIHALSTTEQLRLGYDASNYMNATIASTGVATFNCTAGAGTPYFVFNEAIAINSATLAGTELLYVAKNSAGSLAYATISGDNGTSDGGAGLIFAYNGTSKWTLLSRKTTPDHCLRINDKDGTTTNLIQQSAGGLYQLEQAAANGDIAGYGQLWVKNDTPNTLWWTDDAGTDHQIAFV